MEYIKLEPDFKKRWVIALKSGEYEQCASQLTEGYNDKPKYCCLGVACIVAGIERPLLQGGTRISTHLIKRAKELEPLGSTEAANELIGMNDSLGFSFRKIADWIEQNL